MCCSCFFTKEANIITYVTSDLHGYPLKIFNELLNEVGFNDNDVLYILGDVIDRGTDGINIIKWLMRQSNAQLILGNHEAMLMANDFLFEEVSEHSISMLTDSKLNMYKTWLYNSGQVTINAISTNRKSEIKNILAYLRDLPLYKTITVKDKDFILTHSGLGNFRPDKKLTEYTTDELLWTRPKHDVTYFSDITTIFGHTPTLYYGNEYKGKIFKTDTWIDVDVGVGFGQNPILLRLDDMKVFYSKELVYKN